MEALESVLGRREFKTSSEIAHHITTSKNFRPEEENPTDAHTLLFFETSKQHTWLVATPKRLYCILDDVRKPRPHINWSMSRRKVLEGTKLEVDLKTAPKTQKTGLIDFGPHHRRWLFSKSLFEGESIEEAVRAFITAAMVS